jgi:hypothetical protein
MFKVIMIIARFSPWFCRKAIAHYEKYTKRPFILIVSLKLDMLHKIKEGEL